MFLLWEVNAEYDLPDSHEKEFPLSIGFDELFQFCSVPEVYFANRKSLHTHKKKVVATNKIAWPIAFYGFLYL